jgi:choline dehydrogenase-like flavoprotein
LSSYDWAYETVKQTDSGDVAKRWPRGKGLGGSGAINGLYWNKGDEQEYDAWGRKFPPRTLLVLSGFVVGDCIHGWAGETRDKQRGS